jgi:hypothetical protein
VVPGARRSVARQISTEDRPGGQEEGLSESRFSEQSYLFLSGDLAFGGAAAMRILESTLDTLKMSECRNRAAGKLADCAKLLKLRRGEMAEWLKAAVC